MKRFISFLIALCLAFALVSCVGDHGEKTIAVFYYSYPDVYISTVRDVLDRQLTAAGIQFTNYDGNNHQATQLDQINNALANGDSLLVVNLVDTDSDTTQTIVDAATAKNVPVIFFNRPIPDSMIKDDVLFIGTDAPEAGHLQGKMIGEYLVENFDKVDLNGDGVITYAMLKGQEGNAEADARTKYAIEDANAILVENGLPKLQYYNPSAFSGVDNQYYEVDKHGTWSAAQGYDIISRAIANSTDMIELIVANNDAMAHGAIQALQAAGYNESGKTVIPVFGVDATEQAKQHIRFGEMTGTVKQDNVGMATAIMLAVNNAIEGNALNEGIVGTHGEITFTSAPGIDNKIYVPYTPYLG